VFGCTVSLATYASANPTNLNTGRAYDIKTTVLGVAASVGPDTGVITNSGNSLTKLTAVGVSSSLVNATVLDASVQTFVTEGVKSTADVATASVTIPGAPAISATAVSALSTTTCRNHGTSTGSGVTGTLNVNGTTYPIASPPNTVISLGPLGSITLNEQHPIPNGLAVKAIHVRVPSLHIEIVIASADSSVPHCA
jgi:hypothetical protein